MSSPGIRSACCSLLFALLVAGAASADERCNLSQTQFNFSEVRGAERRTVQHFFMNSTDDCRVGMAVDQRAPRLNKINQDVPVHIRDMGPRGFFEVNWIAMDRFERSDG